MKFIVSSAALLKELSSINGVITTNPVVPILENFLFEIEEKEGNFVEIKSPMVGTFYRAAAPGGIHRIRRRGAPRATSKWTTHCWPI